MGGGKPCTLLRPVPLPHQPHANSHKDTTNEGVNSQIARQGSTEKAISVLSQRLQVFCVLEGCQDCIGVEEALGGQ